jgi:hypothetical protein
VSDNVRIRSSRLEMGRKMAEMVEYEEKRRAENRSISRPISLDDPRLKEFKQGREDFVVERLLQYISSAGQGIQYQLRSLKIRGGTSKYIKRNVMYNFLLINNYSNHLYYLILTSWTKYSSESSKDYSTRKTRFEIVIEIIQYFNERW